MPGLLNIETHSAQPVTWQGVRLVPFAQSLRIQIPGLGGGLVWNRPVSVLAVYPDGREEVLPVRDPTRQVLWMVMGAGMALCLFLMLNRRRLDHDRIRKP